MKLKDSKGNVSLEFIFVSAALLIPISFLAIYIYSIASTYVAISNAARMAARIYVLEDSEPLAKQKVQRAVSRQLQDYGLRSRDFRAQVSCSARPCLTSGEYVTISITGKRRVKAPFAQQISVTLTASQTLEVDGV